jgi:hypothetical protein
MLASLDCCAENVVVKAIIIAELELRNVKMQVSFADIVESADEHRPRNEVEAAYGKASRSATPDGWPDNIVISGNPGPMRGEVADGKRLGSRGNLNPGVNR